MNEQGNQPPVVRAASPYSRPYLSLQALGVRGMLSAAALFLLVVALLKGASFAAAHRPSKRGKRRPLGSKIGALAGLRCSIFVAFDVCSPI